MGNESQLTMIFNLSLLEHAVMCRIVQGQGSQAIQEVCCSYAKSEILSIFTNEQHCSIIYIQVCTSIAAHILVNAKSDSYFLFFVRLVNAVQ